MAVAFDATSESHTDPGVGSASEASFSWTHTPVGTPRGVLVFTFIALDTEFATAVTYGGQALAKVTGGSAVDTAAEVRRCTAWFLGSGIPTGAQTVQVTRTNNSTEMYAVCATVTASSDTAISGTPVLLQGDQVLAEQNVDSGADTALRFAGYAGGANSPAAPVAGANSTLMHQLIANFGGTGGAIAVRETTPGSGSRPVGFVLGASDDVAAVHLAIAEGGGGGGVVTRTSMVS